MKEALKEVFSTMKRDDITVIAKTDPLIQELGKEWLLLSVNMRPNRRSNYVSNKMREVVAKVLKPLRAKNGSVVSVDDIINPVKFDDVVTAALETDGWSGDSFHAPSTAIKLSYSLKRLASIKKGQAVRTGDQIAQDHAFEFFELVDRERSLQLTKVARFNIRQRKFNKVIRLCPSQWM